MVPFKCGLQLPEKQAGEPKEPGELPGSCLEAIDVLGVELRWASLTHLKGISHGADYSWRATKSYDALKEVTDARY